MCLFNVNFFIYCDNDISIINRKIFKKINKGEYMAGIKSTEVLRYDNVNRFASYFNANDKSVSLLEKAYEEKDITSVRSIISNNSAYNFIGNLLVIYDSLVDELARKILDNNSRYRQTDKQYGSGIAQPPQRKSNIQYNTYKKNGKEYKRSNGKRWTKREETFIKNNKNKTNKQLVEDYNKYFPNRTKSSIIQRKYKK